MAAIAVQPAELVHQQPTAGDQHDARHKHGREHQQHQRPLACKAVFSQGEAAKAARVTTSTVCVLARKRLLKSHRPERLAPERARESCPA